PPEEQEQAELSIAPACGPPETEVLVEGRNFPADVLVSLELGRLAAPAGDFDVVERLVTDPDGSFDTQETIPDSARQGQDWILVGVVRSGGSVSETPSNLFLVTSSEPAGATTTYVVQRGDTLRSIAARLDTTIAALIEANPNISDPSLIVVGQRLIIPGPEAGDPSVEISPSCGPAGTEIDVVVTNFPASTRVNIGTGVYRTQPETVDQESTDGNGELETTVSIPDTANRNEPWVVTVTTVSTPRIQASSNIFTVTGPRNPAAPATYVVQPGDMLNDIATRFGVPVQVILAANPQITNPNRLTVGERLRIPGQEASVTIAPLTGPPGSTVRVEVSDFPRNIDLDIGVGKSSSSFEVVEVGQTDARGSLVTQASIPDTARPNERWLVVAVAVLGRFEIKAASDFFTVTGTPTGGQAIVTIWPMQGRAGTQVYVVAAGFPSYTPASINLGQQGGDIEVVQDTVSDINGTLSSQVTIPKTAQPGQEWVINVATTQGATVEATSPVFSIIR
ncbi:MAG TPA: LysM peptidoglycan-binding domain-containing protein, partial [Anaerolineales bacterium]|nr:LysM peptidoglycan-binding domain-containing protein [Anaerolineales bacterium]